MQAHTQSTVTCRAKNCTHTTAIMQAHTQCTGTYGAKSFSSSGESSKPCSLRESRLNFLPALCWPRAALSAVSLHSQSQLLTMTALRSHECHHASTHTQCSVTCRAKRFSSPRESSKPRSLRESGLSPVPARRSRWASLRVALRVWLDA